MFSKKILLITSILFASNVTCVDSCIEKETGSFCESFINGALTQILPPISYFVAITISQYHQKEYRLAEDLGFGSGIVTVAAVQAAVIYVFYRGIKSIYNDYNHTKRKQKLIERQV